MTTATTGTTGTGTTTGTSFKKDAEQSGLRTLLAQIVPTVAEAALDWTPQKIQDMLTRNGLFTHLMPLFSQGVGITLIGSLRKFFGNSAWAQNLIDPLDDFRAVFFSELGRKLRERHTPAFAGQEAMINVAFPTAMVFVVPPDMDHYHHAGCPVFLGKRKIVTAAKPGSKGNPGTPASSEDRTDIVSYTLEQVMHTTCSAASCCKAMIMADINTIVERAAKIASSAKPKKEKVAGSFLTFIGKARKGKIEGVETAKIPTMLGFFYQLDPHEIPGLDEIDNDDEFLALFEANDIDQFRKLIKSARDRRLSHHLAELLGLPANFVHTGGRMLKAGWNKAVATVPSLVEGTIDAAVMLDDVVTYSANQFADSAQRKAEINRFARDQRIKDKAAFLKWVLQCDSALGNPYDLNTINMAQAYTSFGRRS